jgi:hypothetical protein
MHMTRKKHISFQINSFRCVFVYGFDDLRNITGVRDTGAVWALVDTSTSLTKGIKICNDVILILFIPRPGQDGDYVFRQDKAFSHMLKPHHIRFPVQ